MSLPSLTKTWQFNVNNAQTAQGTALLDNRTALLAIKNAMIGFGTQPWTVVSSSNSVTANSSDNWTVPTSLVWQSNGVSHSWIVLKQAGIGTNFQILLSCTSGSSTGQILTIRYSPSVGFTGGTSTTDPTASDSVLMLNNASWGGVSADVAMRWSVMQSTDGQCTRVMTFSSGSLGAFWAFEKFANPTAGTPGASNTGWVSLTTTLAGTTVQNSITATTAVSYESVANISIASEISGAYDIFPIGVTCTATVGARGRLGTLQDIWFTSSGTATGDTMPSSGTTGQFVIINNVLLPWNNGSFNLS